MLTRTLKYSHKKLSVNSFGESTDSSSDVAEVALLERRLEIKHNNCLNMFSLRLCINSLNILGF